MKYKIIKSSEVKGFDKGFIKVKQLLSDEEIEGLSVSIVKISRTGEKLYLKGASSGFYHVANLVGKNYNAS